MDCVRLHRFARLFRVVAIEADLFPQYPPVLLARLAVDLVAGRALSTGREKNLLAPVRIAAVVHSGLAKIVGIRFGRWIIGSPGGPDFQATKGY